MHYRFTIIAVLLLALATTSVARSFVKAATPRTNNHQIQIVAEEMCCKGCARKVSGQLYAARGVKEVRVDMKNQTLFVETRPGTCVSPWLAIEAVAKARERPLAVIGSHGRPAIEWAPKRAPKNHQQAQQVNAGGIQR